MHSIDTRNLVVVSKNDLNELAASLINLRKAVDKVNIAALVVFGKQVENNTAPATKKNSVKKVKRPKWTPERRKQFSATMKAKHAAKKNTVASPGVKALVQEVANSDGLDLSSDTMKVSLNDAAALGHE